MTQTTFDNRLGNLDEDAARSSEPAAPQRKAPHVFVTVLLGIVFVVLGFAGAFIVRLALDPEMTPQALYYVELMAAAAGFLILMLGSGAAALLIRLRRPILNRIALFTFAGYGIMSVMLSAALS